MGDKKTLKITGTKKSKQVVTAVGVGKAKTIDSDNEDFIIKGEDESLSNLDVGFKKTKQISVSDVDFTFTSLESQLCVDSSASAQFQIKKYMEKGLWPLFHVEYC